MSSVNYVNSFLQESYLPSTTSKSGSSSTASSAGGEVPPDEVDLSSDAFLRETAESGRIALNAANGDLTSDQASQLYQQVASIQSQIQSDKQADGGTLSPADAQTINQLQSQLSASIYSDAHNGDAPPSTPSTPSAIGGREALEAGRIELNQQAGNITSTQAQQLMTQQTQISQQISSDEQSNGGTLTQAQAQQIWQSQNQASQQIYQAAHGGTPAAQ